MGKRTTFFTVDRKLLDDELWLNEPFTRGQAWVDLIGRAAFKDNDLTMRGELIISERGLSKRWKWSASKVRRFLQKLESDGMIKRSSNRSTNRSTWGSVLRIEKYEDYQNPRSSERSTNRSSNRHLYNNINNINNISLYMPDGMRDELLSLYGDRADALIEDVERYYKQHTDRAFPGWLDAVAQFNANQARWGKKPKKRQKTIAELVEEELGGLDDQ